MTSTVDHSLNRRAAPPILQNAFRPFFLGGAAWAAALVPLWAAEYSGLVPSRLGMIGHAHEMLYGYLAAIICGFALTAIPNWTGRATVAGSGLAALFVLWVAGRIAWLTVDGPIALVADLSFLLVLSGVVIREITHGRNWRNLPVAALILLFTGSHLLFHIPEFYGAAIRGTLSVAALLVALIGGRIVPSFTRNWLDANNPVAAENMTAPMQLFDKAGLAVLALALAFWTVWPSFDVSGILLLAAAATQGARMMRWQGHATLREALVWSLHAGFLWLPIALGLVGAGVLWPAAFPSAAGFHALAAGLIGSMTLAVMTRASLGHTGRARRANRLMTLIYVLVHTGSLARVGAAFAANDPLWLGVGAVMWSGAFLLFVIGYLPMLFAPRQT